MEIKEAKQELQDVIHKARELCAEETWNVYHAYFKILAEQALDSASKEILRKIAASCLMYKNETENYPEYDFPNEETARRIVYAVYEPILLSKIKHVLNHTDLTLLQKQAIENLWYSIQKMLHFKTVKIFTVTEVIFDSVIQTYYDSL